MIFYGNEDGDGALPQNAENLTINTEAYSKKQKTIYQVVFACTIISNGQA